MQKDQYFYCYNKRVSDYLNENGETFINVAIEPKSKKMYSLYKQTEQLSKLLKEYKLNK